MYSLLKAPAWETDGANWPHRAASRFIDAGAHRWHVQTLGDGPDILLIHGTGAASHSWADVMTALSPAFRVTTFDLPGHGFTSSRRSFRPSLPHVADEIGALLDAIDIRPAVIAGHSAGAAIMVEAAQRGAAAPRAMIGVNGAFSPFSGAAGFFFPLMAKLLYINPVVIHAFARAARKSGNVRRLISQTGSQIPERNVEYYAALLQKPAHVAGTLGFMAYWDLSGMEAAIGAAACPCLFIAGENDRAVPPADSRRAAAYAPAGEYRALAGLGHLAHEEQPDRLAALIAGFSAASGIG